MDLNLYRTVGALNRVALGDLADGVEFYSAEKDPVGHADGTIILTPVKIHDGSKRTQVTVDGAGDEDPQD